MNGTNRGWRERTLDRLAAMPPRSTVAISVLLVLAAAAVDWLSEAEIAASLLYLLPIAVAAWGMGRTGGAVVAALSAASWLFVDRGTHGVEVSAAIETVNMIVLTVAYQLFGQLLATLREQLDHERRLAHTDPLTSLHNRRALWSATGRELQRARRGATPFSLVYLDVDGFKGVNDRFGHRVGDELLRRIAVALQSDLRELDMVARLGGDEFAVLLPGTGVSGATRVVARMRRRLRRVAWRPSLDIDFRIGCLTVLDPPADVDRLVERADQLMYGVKRGGGGRVQHEVLSPSVLGGVQQTPARSVPGSARSTRAAT